MCHRRGDPVPGAVAVVAAAAELSFSSTTRRWAKSLQFELVGHLGGNVLEADRGARDALEAHPVERKPRQLAHLDFPLDERVRVGVAVDTQQQELFALFVVAVVLVEDLTDLLHDLGGVP